MEYQTLKAKRRFPLAEIMSFIMIFLMLFKNCSNIPQPIRKTEKQVSKNLRPVLNKIEFHQQRVDASRPVLNSMNLQFEQLKQQLDSLKLSRDTIMILAKQDTIITHQEKEKELMKQVISDLDSVNLGLRYVVSAKDTIIAIKEQQIRKVKRQRNLSLIVNGVLTGLLILK